MKSEGEGDRNDGEAARAAATGVSAWAREAVSRAGAPAKLSAVLPDVRRELVGRFGEKSYSTHDFLWICIIVLS